MSKPSDNEQLKLEVIPCPTCQNVTVTDRGFGPNPDCPSCGGVGRVWADENQWYPWDETPIIKEAPHEQAAE